MQKKVDWLDHMVEFCEGIGIQQQRGGEGRELEENGNRWISYMK